MKEAKASIILIIMLIQIGFYLDDTIAFLIKNFCSIVIKKLRHHFDHLLKENIFSFTK